MKSGDLAKGPFNLIHFLTTHGLRQRDLGKRISHNRLTGFICTCFFSLFRRPSVLSGPPELAEAVPLSCPGPQDTTDFRSAAHHSPSTIIVMISAVSAWHAFVLWNFVFLQRLPLVRDHLCNVGQKNITNFSSLSEVLFFLRTCNSRRLFLFVTLFPGPLPSPSFPALYSVSCISSSGESRSYDGYARLVAYLDTHIITMDYNRVSGDCHCLNVEEV